MGGVGGEADGPPSRRGRWARRAVGAALLAAGAACGSCAAPIVIATAALPVAQASTEAFINGELQSARESTLPRTWQATFDALHELEFDVQYAEDPARSSGWHAYVRAQDPGGPEVKIRLNKVSDRVTEIRIRIGVFGDQAVSRLILARIEGRLPPPPIPEREIGDGRGDIFEPVPAAPAAPPAPGAPAGDATP